MKSFRHYQSRIVRICFIYLGLLGFFIFDLSAASAADNKLESWYTYWGAGLTSITYPNNQDIATARQNWDNSISITADFLGFYWPYKNKTILGFVVNGASDIFWEQGNEIAATTYLPAVSVFHFLTGKIGKGPFLRLDIGPSKLKIQTDIAQGYDSEWGSGILFGGGVGIPISSGTRILINVNYSMRKIEGDTYKVLGLSLGGLF